MLCKIIYKIFNSTLFKFQPVIHVVSSSIGIFFSLCAIGGGLFYLLLQTTVRLVVDPERLVQLLHKTTMAATIVLTKAT